MATLGSNNDYWRILLTDAGGTPTSGDSNRDLLRKLVIENSGTVKPCDSELDLVRKLVDLAGGDTVTGDLFNSYLRQLGELYAPDVDFPPGSSDNDILRLMAQSVFVNGSGEVLTDDSGNPFTF